MKEVTNKWTGNVYTVLSMTDKEVSSRLQSMNIISITETENDNNLFRTNNNYSSDCSYERINHNRR